MKLEKILLIVLVMTISCTGFSQQIFRAIMQKNIELTKKILEADSTAAITKNQNGFSPLDFAANFNQLEIAKLLIEKGADPFEVGNLGRQALHWAAAGGSVEICSMLNDLGADLNIMDEGDRSPLFLAVARNRKNVVDFLLSKNVDIYKKGKRGFEMIYFAIQNNISSIVDHYIKSDFDFTQVLSYDGTTLLFAAIDAKNPELIEFLINKGLDVNQQSDYGDFPLLGSVKQKDLVSIKKLIDLGADINKTDFAGRNALGIASELNLTDLISYLKEKGANEAKTFALDHTYPGFEEPGLTPKLFAPGIISTPDHNERDEMFSPDMKEFYFTRNSRIHQMISTIMVMHKEEDGWQMPQKANFSGKFNDSECFVSFDNQNLYLISQRNPDGSNKPSSWEIWIGDRNGKEFENFRLLDTTNLDDSFYPSLTRNNEFLYTGPGNDLFLAKIKDEKIYDMQKLGPEINTPSGEYNAMISPNGDYIIFTSHGYEDHLGGGDLYISFRKDDNSWTSSINMGHEINSEGTDYCPNVSADEKYFFFTSNRKGTEDIYWVSIDVIENLRKKAFNN